MTLNGAVKGLNTQDWTHSKVGYMNDLRLISRSSLSEQFNTSMSH